MGCQCHTLVSEVNLKAMPGAKFLIDYTNEIGVINNPIAQQVYFNRDLNSVFPISPFAKYK